MIQPSIGIIGGSGLGDALGAKKGASQWVQTPFGLPSSEIVTTQWHGVSVSILQRHGLGHVYGPSQVPYRANMFALKQLGVTHIIASGATGSLREEIEPGHLVIVDQMIDRTYCRPNTFYEQAAVHVELAEPFCPIMRRWLADAAGRIPELTVHETGTYVCIEGPAFSTQAESRMYRTWGGDVIGMTACPEAKLAREAEMAYALVALPTDYDCWRPHRAGQPPQELLLQIIGNLKKATEHSVRLITAALGDLSPLDEPSPAHDALKLAIWSDKTRVDPDEIRRLSVLWGKHY